MRPSECRAAVKAERPSRPFPSSLCAIAGADCRGQWRSGLQELATNRLIKMLVCAYQIIDLICMIYTVSGLASCYISIYIDCDAAQCFDQKSGLAFLLEHASQRNCSRPACTTTLRASKSALA